MSAAVTTPPALYGRDAECGRLADLLEAARASRSGALVLLGEPGVGKSALLADAIARADGMQVCQTVGVESESELAFAALHELTRPLLEHLDEIPPPQAAALAGALGLSSSSDQDRFLVAAGLLSLIAAAAEERPLLCVVDDAHWLDKPSAHALTFAARRLHAEPIALLFAARDGETRTFEASALPELRLSGIAQGAAGALLRELVGPALSPHVRDRLIESTEGNPLALLELSAVLDEASLAGRDPLPQPLPLTTRLESVFLERAAGLSASTQELLLLAAADDTGDPAILIRGARALAVEIDALSEAEEIGLLKLEPRVVFRHPLVRSAIYQAASFSRRQAVHEALVAALDGEEYRDRRAWHLAAATFGTDDEVALELELSAERAKRRSGHSAAAAALERAAALTGDEQAQARRLAGAGEEAWLGGQSSRAKSLLDAARELAAEPTLRAHIAHLRGWIELQLGVALDAYDILLSAAQEVAPVDPRKAAELVHAAGEAAALGGHIAGELATGRLARGLRCDETRDQYEVFLLSGIASMLEGDAAEGAPLLRKAIELAEQSDNPRSVSGAATAFAYLGDMSAASGLWSRAVAESRERGAITSLTYALAMLAPAEMWDYRVASARADASEGLRLAIETGQTNAACYQLAVLARVAAFYGEEAECRANAAEVFELATRHGLGLHSGTATWALGEIELALGMYSEALSRFEIVAAGQPGMSHPGLAWLVAPDHIEAAVRAGHPDQARAAFALFEAWATNVASQSLPLVARCRGLLSDGEEAKEHFEDALRLHAENERPFDRARTELLYGAALRRGRERREARRHLRAALEVFDQLGAARWADRARTELRASGETARRRDPSTIDQLTAQELQIARYVAEGATNKEVAAKLFLSPRTIDFHLRNVFSKLGIASRRELGRIGLDGRPP